MTSWIGQVTFIIYYITNEFEFCLNFILFNNVAKFFLTCVYFGENVFILVKFEAGWYISPDAMSHRLKLHTFKELIKRFSEF